MTLFQIGIILIGYLVSLVIFFSMYALPADWKNPKEFVILHTVIFLIVLAVFYLAGGFK